MRHVLQQLARWLVRALVRLYYPRIEVSGRGLIPRTGSAVLVANHSNSLLDPVIVGIAATRPVRFLAKAPLFETPVFGRLMNAMGMLPAYRAQDDRASVRRNLESLKLAAQALSTGDVVGIFPEGRSHDTVQVQQLRSGAARMAVKAVQEGARELVLVPIGINYEAKQRFRSAIWVRIGRPVNVVRFMARHKDERSAIHALTREIELRLKKVVIHLSDPTQEPFLNELECLLPPPRTRGPAAFSGLHQRKRLADAMNFFHDQEGKSSHSGSTPGAEGTSAAAMADAIRAYRAQLQADGLSPRSPVMRFRSWRLLLNLAGEAVWLSLSLPVAAIGTVFHLIYGTANRPALTILSLSR